MLKANWYVVSNSNSDQIGIGVIVRDSSVAVYVSLQNPLLFRTDFSSTHMKVLITATIFCINWIYLLFNLKKSPPKLLELFPPSLPGN